MTLLSPKTVNYSTHGYRTSVKNKIILILHLSYFNGGASGAGEGVVVVRGEQVRQWDT